MKTTPLLGIILCFFLGTQSHAQPVDPTALPTESHVYKTVAGRELKLWVAKPADWQAGDKRPAIVFFHGGGWTGGKPAALAPQCRHLASLGMVAITVEYRFWDRKTAPSPAICVHDARSALNWVAHHAAELGIDTARLGAGGGSAGGHLAACTNFNDTYNDPADAHQPNFRPKALVLFNPVVNLAAFDGVTEENRAVRKHLSPLQNLTADHPPTIIMVGDSDTTTPPEHDQAYIAQLTKLGIRAELKLYPGQKHGFFNYKPAGNPSYDATIADMDKFLASLGWIKLPPST